MQKLFHLVHRFLKENLCKRDITAQLITPYCSTIRGHRPYSVLRIIWVRGVSLFKGVTLMQFGEVIVQGTWYINNFAVNQINHVQRSAHIGHFLGNELEATLTLTQSTCWLRSLNE